MCNSCVCIHIHVSKLITILSASAANPLLLDDVLVAPAEERDPPELFPTVDQPLDGRAPLLPPPPTLLLLLVMDFDLFASFFDWNFLRASLPSYLHISSNTASSPM